MLFSYTYHYKSIYVETKIMPQINRKYSRISAAQKSLFERLSSHQQYMYLKVDFIKNGFKLKRDREQRFRLHIPIIYRFDDPCTQ